MREGKSCLMVERGKAALWLSGKEERFYGSLWVDGRHASSWFKYFFSGESYVLHRGLSL
jgi:hypothetical protein